VRSLLLLLLPLTLAAQAPDLILHHGKIVAVDAPFSIHQAMAVGGSQIVALGDDAKILALRGEKTRVIDLAGHTVIPGLIDSHTHPVGAAMFEFDHPIPQMDSIAEVLAHVRERAQVVKAGEWINLSQVFITRLNEQRYPTRAELDAAAPNHPVAFRTGPDCMLNSLALKLSGIDRNFQLPPGTPGLVEKDPRTGEPTGVLRNLRNLVNSNTTERKPTEAERDARVQELFADYNSVGLTTISDRNAGFDDIALYERLRDQKGLTVRVRAMQGVGSTGPIEKIEQQIQSIARNPLHTTKDDWLQIIGIKMFLDGGMLTGSAYMRQPWGVSQIYSISDPEYRGVLFIPRERLLPMVRATVASGLQYTAHSVGDGAVHQLLDVYAQLAGEGLPVRETRACITHSNFMSQEAVQQAAKLGVVLDIQPIWLHSDAHTLYKQFGNDRLRWFQPLHSIFAAGGIVGGGSDHMQKIGARRSINQYDPFRGLATAITRRAVGLEAPLHPEEALTRAEALRFYTINNAKLLFLEDRTGSLEPGKLADFAVLDRDLLTCPEEEIVETKVLQTFVGGNEVYTRKTPTK
jgi:predicted amidohydrolase YtcJ